VNREESAEEIIRDIMEGARRTLELLCRRFPSTAGE